ncbi:DUF1731 domain-containing protein [Paenibacillus mesophilus]|nr:DUF1731 domain-containing protein [Paenibacillus mesophilus]
MGTLHRTFRRCAVYLCGQRRTDRDGFPRTSVRRRFVVSAAVPGAALAEQAGYKGYNPIFSPIHVEDCARAFLFLLEQGQAGERYILVDDQPIRSADITTLSAQALQRPDKKRYVPTWLCRMLLGPVLTEYATAHTNFSNGKLKASGFTYLYPTIQSGIEDVVKEWKERVMS